MLLGLGALIAGVLTTLAPCVLPLLPVVVGGSLGQSTSLARRRAYIVAASLGVSVIVFTLLLRATSALIKIPDTTWQLVSGVILISLGLVSTFPQIWDKISSQLHLQNSSNSLLVKARSREGNFGAILTGSALGPVFSSCSPFYGYVIVTVLPASFLQGMFLLLAYVVGLCGTLLTIVLLGQRAIGRAKWIANPEGWFRRGLGIILMAVGFAIIFGLDKDLQTWVIENAVFRPWELDSNFIPN